MPRSPPGSCAKRARRSGANSYGLPVAASCSVRLLECQRTLLVRGAADLAWVEISGVEKPAALVFRQHRSPPHQPWQGQDRSLSCLVVFKAELEGEALPRQELPWLAWLDSAQAAQAAREDVLLEDLLQGGATIIDGSLGQTDARQPPAASWLRLTDSQEALGIALGEGFAAFLAA